MKVSGRVQVSETNIGKQCSRAHNSVQVFAKISLNNKFGITKSENVLQVVS